MRMSISPHILRQKIKQVPGGICIETAQASLEALVETGFLNLEILHPGGLELTREIAELCQIQKDSRVLKYFEKG